MKFKHMFVVGLFIFILGICGYIGLYSQTKININRVDKEYLDTVKIDTIGNQTVDKIIENQPYQNMEQLNKVSGIGDVKYKTLSTVFCTYDTCRFEWFIIFLVIDSLCIVFGTLLMIHKVIQKNTQEQKAKRLSAELKSTLEKNIKK